MPSCGTPLHAAWALTSAESQTRPSSSSAPLRRSCSGLAWAVQCLAVCVQETSSLAAILSTPQLPRGFRSCSRLLQEGAWRCRGSYRELLLPYEVLLQPRQHSAPAENGPSAGSAAGQGAANGPAGPSEGPRGQLAAAGPAGSGQEHGPADVQVRDRSPGGSGRHPQLRAAATIPAAPAEAVSVRPGSGSSAAAGLLCRQAPCSTGPAVPSFLSHGQDAGSRDLTETANTDMPDPPFAAAAWPGAGRPPALRQCPPQQPEPQPPEAVSCSRTEPQPGLGDAHSRQAEVMSPEHLGRRQHAVLS